MARQALSPGERGDIAILKMGEGIFRARARYRDLDGKVRQVSAYGRSRDAAKRALGKRLESRPKRVPGTLQSDTPFRVVAESWFDRVQAGGRLALGTLITYRQTLDSPILPALGDKRLDQIDVDTLDAFLLADALQYPARAKRAKVVLSQVLRHAQKRGLISHNPVRLVDSLPKGETADPRPATVEEVHRLRKTAAAYAAGNLSAGRPPTVPIDAIIDVGLCGLRPGEVLALLRSEMNLDSGVPTVKISGTVTQVPKDFAQGGPTVLRQPAPKTPGSERTIDIPDEVAEKLRALPIHGDLVFATSAGTAYSPKNVARTWRKVTKLANIHGLRLHGLRKTAATEVDIKYGSRASSELLGHTTGSLVERIYVARPTSIQWARLALGHLFQSGT
jgi:integrase